MYLNGEGIAANYKEAARWFTMAAKQNDVQAQYFLGNMYITGAGVVRDPSRAYFWLSVAYAQGAEQAAVQIKQLEGALSNQQLASIKNDLKKLGLNR